MRGMKIGALGKAQDEKQRSRRIIIKIKHCRRRRIMKISVLGDSAIEK
jgi:hypothetical protein